MRFSNGGVHINLYTYVTSIVVASAEDASLNCEVELRATKPGDSLEGDHRFGSWSRNWEQLKNILGAKKHLRYFNSWSVVI